MSGRKRPARVAELIQRTLSSHLIPSLRDPRLGFATVTGVDLSDDLRSARVFVTIFAPEQSKRREAIDALNGAARHFRRDLGRDLRLRVVPTLVFVEDESIARADRIEQLLRDIDHGENQAGGEDDQNEREDGDETSPGEHSEDESE